MWHSVKLVLWGGILTPFCCKVVCVGKRCGENCLLPHFSFLFLACSTESRHDVPPARHDFTTSFRGTPTTCANERVQEEESLAADNGCLVVRVEDVSEGENKSRLVTEDQEEQGKNQEEVTHPSIEK